MKAVAAVAILSLCGCVTAQVAIAPTDVANLERTLQGERRFLRVSMFQTPFFGDATKKLMTPVAPELVRFLEKPNGKPLVPGAVEATLPVGTAVKIAKVEFPSAWAITERVLYTPRTLVWLYVEVEGGAKNPLPMVLVLRPGLSSQQDFMTELERHLTREDPAKLIEGFSEGVRDAIKSKRVMAEMSAEAVEIAWGFPESKRIELEGSTRKETWKWGNGARTALLVDGKLVSFTGASANGS